MRLKGQTAIITGAGSGIGKTTALMAAREGATVVCADINEAETTAGEIGEAGGRAEAATLDVREWDAWQALAERTRSEYGRIDCLANIAGITLAPDTVLEQTEEGWQRVIDIDLKGVWLGMRAVMPTMLEQGSGRVVNISSLAAVIGLVNLASYSAAKAGVIGLTRQAAMEYAKQGVKINAIAPGIINTPILAGNTPEMTAAFSAATPLGRIGEPEDIGGMIIHLFSPGGDFITGQVFVVDGGWSAQ